jgi:hypothetical protein
LLSVGTVATATVVLDQNSGVWACVGGIFSLSFVGIGWRNPADTKYFWYRLN